MSKYDIEQAKITIKRLDEKEKKVLKKAHINQDYEVQTRKDGWTSYKRKQVQKTRSERSKNSKLIKFDDPSPKSPTCDGKNPKKGCDDTDGNSAYSPVSESSLDNTLKTLSSTVATSSLPKVHGQRYQKMELKDENEKLLKKSSCWRDAHISEK